MLCHMKESKLSRKLSKIWLKKKLFSWLLPLHRNKSWGLRKKSMLSGWSGRAPLPGSVRTTSSLCSHLQCTQLRQSHYLSKLKSSFGLETAIFKLLVKLMGNKVRLGYTSRHGSAAVKENREKLFLCWYKQWFWICGLHTLWGVKWPFHRVA